MHSSNKYLTDSSSDLLGVREHGFPLHLLGLVLVLRPTGETQRQAQGLGEDVGVVPKQQGQVHQLGLLVDAEGRDET